MHLSLIIIFEFLCIFASYWLLLVFFFITIIIVVFLWTKQKHVQLPTTHFNTWISHDGILQPAWTMVFLLSWYYFANSLKMECEKLVQEKTEMQRHYVMVSASLTHHILKTQNTPNICYPFDARVPFVILCSPCLQLFMCICDRRVLFWELLSFCAFEFALQFHAVLLNDSHTISSRCYFRAALWAHLFIFATLFFFVPIVFKFKITIENVVLPFI